MKWYCEVTVEEGDLFNMNLRRFNRAEMRLAFARVGLVNPRIRWFRPYLDAEFFAYRSRAEAVDD